MLPIDFQATFHTSQCTLAMMEIYVSHPSHPHPFSPVAGQNNTESIDRPAIYSLTHLPPPTY